MMADAIQEVHDALISRGYEPQGLGAKWRDRTDSGGMTIVLERGMDSGHVFNIRGGYRDDEARFSTIVIWHSQTFEYAGFMDATDSVGDQRAHYVHGFGEDILDVLDKIYTFAEGIGMS